MTKTILFFLVSWSVFVGFIVMTSDPKGIYVFLFLASIPISGLSKCIIQCIDTQNIYLWILIFYIFGLIEWGIIGYLVHSVVMYFKNRIN